MPSCYLVFDFKLLLTFQDCGGEPDFLACPDSIKENNSGEEGFQVLFFPIIYFVFRLWISIL